MKIILAVDGSKHSQWAEELLSRVSPGGGHRVEVLSVMPVVVPGKAGGSSLPEVLRECGNKLVRVVAQGLSNKFKTSTKVIESYDVAGAVLDRAKRTGADLIVLGARGLSPLKTFFLGSVSHKVVRHADCSVLVAHRKPGRALKILAAMDGSPESRRAVGFLRSLGVPRSSSLSFLHVVVEPLVYWIPETGFPGGYGSVAAFEESLKALRRRGERILAEAKREWKDRFPAVRSLLREGHPASEILKAAEDTKSNMVVLGRRGLSRTDRFLMGSVSQKVTSYAPCAALIVH